MEIRKVITNEQSIHGQLEKISIEKAVSEYLWNSFDANSKVVSLNFERNGDIENIRDLSIVDDGDGIEMTSLEETFDIFLDSKKRKNGNIITRGRHGRGRFSFAKYFSHAEWITNSQAGLSR